MDINAIKTQFEQAEHYHKSAQSELNRPAEDVLPYMACGSMHKSIK